MILKSISIESLMFAKVSKTYFAVVTIGTKEMNSKFLLAIRDLLE